MKVPVFATPQAAEAAFYDAFERADLKAMMNVWADDEGIICIHPIGPRLLGRQLVEESWRGIFAGGSTMRFHITGIRCTQEDRLAVHCVHENIDHGPQFRQHSLVIATNLYRLTDQGWRMILHHASPSITSRKPDASPPRSIH